MPARAPTTGGPNWAGRLAQSPLFMPVRAQLGLLARVGRIFDWPSRKLIREPITGIPDASGRDVLEKLGVLGPNKPGFDMGDVLGFGAELATDPLTYVTGVGVATKGAKLMGLAERAGGLAKAATRMGDAATAATHLAARERYLAEAAKLGMTTPIAKGWGEQARLGQRALVNVGVPFTRAEKPLVAAPAALEFLQKVGQGIRGTAPVRGLERLFSTRAGRLPETAPFYELADVEKAGATLEAGGVYKGFEDAISGIAKETGLPKEDIWDRLTRGTEALGQPLRIRSKAQALLGGAKASGKRRAIAKAERQATKLELKAQEAEKALGELPAGGMPVVEQLSDLFHALLQEETRTGARDPLNVLRAMTKGYAPRVAGEGLTQFRKENPNLWKSLLARLHSTAMGSKIKREAALLEEFTPEASQKLQELYKLKGPFFERNPARAAAQRALESKKAVVNAKLARGLIDEFAEEITEETAHRLVPIGRFIKEAGLEISAKPWKGQGIRADMAAEYGRLIEKTQLPEEIHKFWQTFDAVSGVFRTALTTPFPAFHVRNLFSDTFLSWLGDGADLRRIPDALKWIRDPEKLQYLEKIGVLRGSGARAAMADIGARETTGVMARFYGKHPGAKKAMDVFEKKYAQQVENFTRTWHFLSKKAQGLSDLDAAASVRKWLLDYKDLTPFEKSVMRRTFLFYQWPRKVLPLMFRAYAERTGKMAALTRLTTQPSQQRSDVPVPEFVRQSSAIPIGTDEQGNPRFLFGMGSPLEELNKLDLTSPEGGFFGGARELMRKVGMQLNPLLLRPAEMATGQELFFDRPIMLHDKAPPILAAPGLRQLFGVKEQTMPGGGVRYHGDPLRLYALMGSPASRAVQTTSRGLDVLTDVDPRSSGAMNALQTITGMKVARVDPIDRLRTQIDQLTRQLRPLQREGLVGEFPVLFARTVEGQKDPRVLEILAKQRELRKGLKGLREAGTQAPP